MSLTGNLEDLPLLDIIQIVSFSKKTGYLTIRARAGEAAIVFDSGSVISSFTWDSPPLDPRARALPEGKRHKLLRNRIEMALEQLIRLHEGQFSFSLTEAPPSRIGARDVSEETLSPGINAQEILIDLARGMDEDRRDSTAVLEASFAEPEADTVPPADEGAPEASAVPPPEVAEPPPAVAPAPTPATPARPVAAAELGPLPLDPVDVPPPRPAAVAPPPPPAAASRPAILLVDDEDDVRQTLADHFRRGGWEVIDAEDPDSACKKASKLGREQTPFLLVTDLGMPTSGGGSFQGGFEVVKRLWKMNLQPPVLMMTESLSPALQARARQMNVSSFVFKPGLSKLDPEQFQADLKAFAHKLLQDVLPRMAGQSGGPRRSPAGKTDAPAAVPAPAGPPSPPASDDEIARQFARLQKHLEELRRPGDATQISLLVMKVAREFFERGMLFVVKNDEVRGLGGFGPAAGGHGVNLLARDIVIPLGQPSFFREVVQTLRPFSGPLPEGPWSSTLMGRIGRFQSRNVALLPLLAHREAIALLFGDNPETGRELGRLDALEVFISQAGIALENAFLQRKLEALENAGT